MPKRALILIKAVGHVLCLLPLTWLYHLHRSGEVARNADPIEFITHFTGDWALWILLVSLAITPLRRISIRVVWLIRLRRMIGLYAFFYATLHLATYLFLFSGYDIVGVIDGVHSGHPAIILQQFHQVWPLIWDDILKRGFLLVGFFSWVILFMMAVTSPATVMRAVGGMRWQRLHQLVYLAAIAAVVHYWWMVKTGVLTPWKVTAILAVLLSARIAYSAYKRFPQERRLRQGTRTP